MGSCMAYSKVVPRRIGLQTSEPLPETIFIMYNETIVILIETKTTKNNYDFSQDYSSLV